MNQFPSLISLSLSFSLSLSLFIARTIVARSTRSPSATRLSGIYIAWRLDGPARGSAVNIARSADDAASSKASKLASCARMRTILLY